MSGKYLVVSWEDLVRCLERLGYKKISQRGSHLKMRIDSESVIIIPAHKTISIGVLKSIVKEVSRITGKSETELLKILGKR